MVSQPTCDLRPRQASGHGSSARERHLPRPAAATVVARRLGSAAEQRRSNLGVQGELGVQRPPRERQAAVSQRLASGKQRLADAERSPTCRVTREPGVQRPPLGENPGKASLEEIRVCLMLVLDPLRVPRRILE